MNRFLMEGERINIGFLSKESIPFVMDFYMRNQERIAQFNPPVSEEYLEPEFWEKKVRYRNSALKREKALDFFLFLPDRPQRIVGHIRLFNLESSPRCSCEIGYTIDGLLEGGGFMFEALGMALSFAKNGLNLHRVVALCHPENDKSKKLLSALGFREEGVSHESMLLNGVWQDMAVFSCIL